MRIDGSCPMVETVGMAGDGCGSIAEVALPGGEGSSLVHPNSAAVRVISTTIQMQPLFSSADLPL
jgi:hypothetical protein